MNKDTNDPILQNIVKNSRSYDEWLIGHLKENPDEAQGYLEAVFEGYEGDGDIGAILLAVRDVVNAQGGIDQIARRTGMSREELSTMLDGNGTPHLESLLKILSGLGFRIRLERQEDSTSTKEPAVEEQPVAKAYHVATP